MSLTTFFTVLFFALCVMAISVWFIVKQIKANRLREENIRAGEIRYQEERQKRIDSINVLLKVAGTDEVDWIEASIRIKHLLDQLGIDLSADEDVSAFYIISAKTEHIPTHEQWKELPKTARMKFKKEMLNYEFEYAEHLERAKLSLLSYSFS